MYHVSVLGVYTKRVCIHQLFVAARLHVTIVQKYVKSPAKFVAKLISLAQHAIIQRLEF